ncbi:N-acetyltransferase [Buttiauxella warmboldiae]|uniref:N-acetyltransferase n=1 Tax=Buttiauxella warmboldiae TaxID=82993 RepID=A0A3N5E9K7_9ENTR|nr:GNAT family N-acetyltransferase [Buttiauxella warmboldiae]RPH28136.1 N-acetyltransferase [Buttiauxella warmboldiae]
MSNFLTGKTINLKLVGESDAEFIYSLRNNNKLNQYLTPSIGTVEDQKKWIKKYKKRESDGKEYYFLIAKNERNENIGTVRLYDFRDEEKSFCWGSWILTENKTVSSALETALLVYNYAFNQLGFEKSHFDVRKENKKVVDFHLKLGSRIIQQNDSDYFFVYEKEVFFSKMNTYNKFLVK